MNPSEKVRKTTADSANDGMINSSAARGQTVIQSYGKDSSSVKGSSENERGRSMTNTGLSKSMKA